MARLHLEAFLRVAFLPYVARYKARISYLPLPEGRLRNKVMEKMRMRVEERREEVGKEEKESEDFEEMIKGIEVRKSVEFKKRLIICGQLFADNICGQTFADNICGQYLRTTFAGKHLRTNICGNYLRQTLADNICGQHLRTNICGQEPK